jgi:hypothetical protein
MFAISLDGSENRALVGGDFAHSDGKSYVVRD